MPTEFRRITFSNQELREAIVLYNSKSIEKLPEGEILHCEVLNEDKVYVRIVIQTHISENEKIIKLEPTYVGAILINYCKIKSIPLPKCSEKSLQITGDNIALQINVGVAEKKLFRIVDEGSAIHRQERAEKIKTRSG